MCRVSDAGRMRDGGEFGVLRPKASKSTTGSLRAS
jgi:hypothetical protein